MSAYDRWVDVVGPPARVYERWTGFEEFPTFMRGVRSVERLDESHTRWSVSMHGVSRRFDAETTEQVPGERIAWRSTSGPAHHGHITFRSIDDDHTRVHLKMRFDPAGAVEHLGDVFGFVSSRVQEDLQQFKEHQSVSGSLASLSGRVPRWLRDALNRQAAAEGRSVADVFQDALREYVGDERRNEDARTP
jgi:uncharacterized membrane protein